MKQIPRHLYSYMIRYSSFNMNMHSKQTNQLYTRLNTAAFATYNGIQFVAAAMCLVIVLLASRILWKLHFNSEQR